MQQTRIEKSAPFPKCRTAPKRGHRAYVDDYSFGNSPCDLFVYAAGKRRSCGCEVTSASMARFVSHQEGQLCATCSDSLVPPLDIALLVHL